jgi:hypothetical protein
VIDYAEHYRGFYAGATDARDHTPSQCDTDYPTTDYWRGYRQGYRVVQLTREEAQR